MQDKMIGYFDRFARTEVLNESLTQQSARILCKSQNEVKPKEMQGNGF